MNPRPRKRSLSWYNNEDYSLGWVSVCRQRTSHSYGQLCIYDIYKNKMVPHFYQNTQSDWPSPVQLTDVHRSTIQGFLCRSSGT